MTLRPFIKGLLLTILPLSLCCLPVRGQQLQAALSHYSADDGLTSNAISKIRRDVHGYIWMATWNGLSRFDGYHFHNYLTGIRSGIPHLHNRILTIEFDHAQNVWMVMYDGRIFMLNRKTDCIVNPLEGTAEAENLKTDYPLFPTADGRILAITREDGICVFSTDNDNKITVTKIHTNGIHVNTIVESDKGEFWAGTDHGIHRLKLNDGTIQESGVFEEEKINCMYSDGYNIYAGTESGKIVTFAPGQEPRTIVQQPSRITAIYIDKHQQLWFSQNEHGVLRLNLQTGNIKKFTQRILIPVYDSRGAEFSEVNDVLWIMLSHGGFGYYNREADELEYFHNDPSNSWNLSNSVNAFTATEEGVVWESTSRHGLEKLEIMQRIITREKLFADALVGSPSNEIRALYYDQQRKQLLMGNKQSTLSIFKNGERTDYHSETFGRIYGINKDRAGNYWLASKGSGLIRMRPEGNDFSYIYYKHDPADAYSLNNNDTYCTVEDKEGNIWVATYGGGVNILQKQPNGSFKALHKGNALNSYPKDKYQKIRSLALDKEGNVWAGTTDGLLIMSLRNKKFVIQKAESSNDPKYAIGCNDIVCLACDKNGSMWIGTNGGGLSHVIGRDDEGRWKFETFTVRDGLPSDEIMNITFGANDYIWFSTDHMLCSYDATRHIFSVFGMQEGVDDTMCSEGGAVALPDGNIIFGTTEGYYVVDRKKLTSSNGKLLKLRITDFMIDDKIVSPQTDDILSYYVPESKSVELPKHNSVFSFRFASLNYQLQTHVHYQYKLESYDTDWRNAGKDRTATYADVPTGNYKFMVKAFLVESPENYDIRTIDVKVPPYWLFSTGAVWTFIILMGGALLTIIIMIQEKAKKKKTKKNVLKVGHQDITFNRTDDYEFMKKQMEWLETHFSDTEVTQEDLVAQSTLGHAAYARLLESYTGMSPRDFITDFRLKKALQLLDEDSGLLMSEIITSTGFGDPVYFTRAFKKKTGLTPTQYREQKQTGIVGDMPASDNVEETHVEP